MYFPKDTIICRAWRIAWIIEALIRYSMQSGKQFQAAHQEDAISRQQQLGVSVRQAMGCMHGNVVLATNCATEQN